jgi:hypothetical protein
MTEFNREEALAFIESMRLTLVNRVGFRWMVERLDDLADYVRGVADENEQLKAYLNAAGMTDAYESGLTAPANDVVSGDDPEAPE